MVCSSRKKTGIHVPCRLQTELQSTIVFVCYDNDQLLKTGKSAKVKTLKKKMLDLYMPPSKKGEDHISYSELFLPSLGVFKHLFTHESIPECVDSENNPDINEKLLIPSIFTGRGSVPYFIGPNCINLSLLTRKNKSNPADISANTLYQNAKKVEAYCRKNLAICARRGVLVVGRSTCGVCHGAHVIWLTLRGTRRGVLVRGCSLCGSRCRALVMGLLVAKRSSWGVFCGAFVTGCSLRGTRGGALVAKHLDLFGWHLSWGDRRGVQSACRVALVARCLLMGAHCGALADLKP